MASLGAVVMQPGSGVCHAQSVEVEVRQFQNDTGTLITEVDKMENRESSV